MQSGRKKFNVCYILTTHKGLRIVGFAPKASVIFRRHPINLSSILAASALWDLTITQLTLRILKSPPDCYSTVPGGRPFGSMRLYSWYCFTYHYHSVDWRHANCLPEESSFFPSIPMPAGASVIGVAFVTLIYTFHIALSCFVLFSMACITNHFSILATQGSRVSAAAILTLFSNISVQSSWRQSRWNYQS